LTYSGHALGRDGCPVRIVSVTSADQIAVSIYVHRLIVQSTTSGIERSPNERRKNAFLSDVARSSSRWTIVPTGTCRLGAKWCVPRVASAISQSREWIGRLREMWITGMLGLPVHGKRQHFMLSFTAWWCSGFCFR